jgi:ubiquinone/menaquinone biosynthesis C-methylase UbiE
MPESAETHRETTRREFSKQAESFERPGSIFRDRDILDWIGQHVPVSSTDLVLDVAGGSGQLGRYLAERAAFAVVADLTPEMLATGAAAARDAGTNNVLFAEGDATRLPFADAQFDVVACRFAFHHFDDPALAAREMARVCRPGGLVAVIDMVAEPGEPDRRDELERLRDPSHTRALDRDELLQMLADAGVDAEPVSERMQTMDAARWVDQGKPGDDARNEITAALKAEGAGGEPTGLRVKRADDRLTIEHSYVIARGRRS